MQIGAFMALYNNKKKNNEHETFIKEHIKNEYVSYEKKADIANAIIKACYYKKDDSDHEYLYIDSVAKYMLTCMSIVDLYTDIERQKSDGKILEDFNILNKSGVIDTIVANVDQRELSEFKMILNLVSDDVIANEYENHAFIRKQVERFGQLISTAFTPVLQNLDIDKLKETILQINNEPK